MLSLGRIDSRFILVVIAAFVIGLTSGALVNALIFPPVTETTVITNTTTITHTETTSLLSTITEKHTTTTTYRTTHTFVTTKSTIIRTTETSTTTYTIRYTRTITSTKVKTIVISTTTTVTIAPWTIYNGKYLALNNSLIVLNPNGMIYQVLWLSNETLIEASVDATGGDVEIMLFKASDFVKWIKGQDAQPLASGRSIRYNVPEPDFYVLVIINRGSEPAVIYQVNVTVGSSS